MINARELSQMAQTAALQVAETLLENLISNRLKPSPEESRAFVLALSFTIAQLELYLKLHLPENEREKIRELLDSFSSVVVDNVKKLQQEVDNKQEPGTICT